jgi:hypothetical protein
LIPGRPRQKADKHRRLGDSSHSPGNDPEEYSPWGTAKKSMIHIDHLFIEPTGPHGAIGMETAG